MTFLRGASARRPGPLVNLGIALFGLLLCALVVKRYLYERQIEREGVLVAAAVQDIQVFPGDTDRLTLVFVHGGRRYEIQDMVSDRLARGLRSGDSLGVRFIPDRPEHFLIDDRGFAPLWTGLLIGFGFLLGGLIGLAGRRRPPPQSGERR